MYIHIYKYRYVNKSLVANMALVSTKDRVAKKIADSVHLNLGVFLLLYIFEKREESFRSFSLHSQRPASLESCSTFFLLALFLPLLLPLLNLLIYHHPHVLLEQEQRFRLQKYNNFLKSIFPKETICSFVSRYTNLPGLQLLRQRHLLLDGVEKLLS